VVRVGLGKDKLNFWGEASLKPSSLSTSRLDEVSLKAL
jgi:hypothetical protein